MTNLNTVEHGGSASVSGRLFDLYRLVRVDNVHYMRGNIRTSDGVVFVEFPPDVYAQFECLLRDGEQMILDGWVDRDESTPMLSVEIVR